MRRLTKKEGERIIMEQRCLRPDGTILYAGGRYKLRRPELAGDRKSTVYVRTAEGDDYRTLAVFQPEHQFLCYADGQIGVK